MVHDIFASINVQAYLLTFLFNGEETQFVCK